jgi:hypothetical protein
MRCERERVGEKKRMLRSGNSKRERKLHKRFGEKRTNRGSAAALMGIFALYRERGTGKRKEDAFVII